VQIVLIRVGVDTGAGGILGPVFEDGSFEYIPIPDRFRGTGVDSRTYGTVRGSRGKLLIEYFPERLQSRCTNQSIHFDPEFETFTYGDPSALKSRLKTLQKGDLLVMYAGLEGWDFHCDPALYLIGFFVVSCAGLPSELAACLGEGWRGGFERNFHVRHGAVFDDQRHRLVLVKGDEAKSRLLSKAVRISEQGNDRAGRPIQILSSEMRKNFGDFDGHVAIQRSPPRWVLPGFVERAAEFVTSLR
jgi:Nucleotide modification associated domain 3